MSEIGSHTEGLLIVQAIGECDKIINSIRDAVKGYYEDLDRREHGAIAVYRAFRKIEKVLEKAA